MRRMKKITRKTHTHAFSYSIQYRNISKMTHPPSPPHNHILTNKDSKNNNINYQIKNYHIQIQIITDMYTLMIRGKNQHTHPPLRPPHDFTLKIAYMPRNRNSNYRYKSALNNEIHIHTIHFSIKLDLHGKRKKKLML